jgi:general L-amino acid transport system permease protein
MSSSAYTGNSKTLPPPVFEQSLLVALRKRFAGNPISLAATIGFMLAVVIYAPGILRWFLFDATFYSVNGEECRQGAGACWAVIGEKYRVILFGTYAYDQQWRPLLVILLLALVSVVSAIPRLWSYWLGIVWTVTIGACLLLMSGGVFGLPHQSTHHWGGLPMTMLLFIGTVVGGIPTAILLALGRQSTQPVIKILCTLFIEITRGIPLIVVLFIASLIFPLFLPETITVDKLLRAQIGMILFFSAYAAEVIRGGLQAIPLGQYEAADAIGLGYWRRTQIVVLPQAMRIVAPALMNDIIRSFKNTTYVAILGLFDMLGATRAALEDVEWVRFTPEAYIFIFAIYFVICTTMSEYAKWLERRIEKEQSS